MATSGLGIGADDWYRLLFEEASDGVFFSNAEGEYFDVNRSGHRMLGYEPGELIGKHIDQVIIERDIPRLRATLAAVGRGEAQTQIWPMLRKDGSTIELEVLPQLLSNGAVLAIVRNVEARTEFGRKLQASEAKLRSILTTAPDTIMTVDRQGTILFINRTHPAYTPEQVVGTSCYDYVRPEMRSRVVQAIEHVFCTRNLDQYEIEGPPDADGQRRWTAVRAGPQIEGDHVVAVTLCATDVSEQKHAERARSKLEEQLRQAQKMESVGQLAGGVAHDFNNMLTTIGAFVELAQDDLPPDAPVREQLAGIAAAAARGATLTQQLLAFARKKIVQPQDIDLSSVVKRIAPMIRRLLGEHIRVELALATPLRPVKVDVGSIEQVIMNLIVNARDAMPDGGVLTLATEAIELGASVHSELAPGRYVMLTVTDTGVGMGPDVRARLFEPFFTTKAQGSGTGLGLAMCHGIVKQAGGMIAVEAELGGGSSFSIYLPCHAASSVSALPAPRPTPASTGHETVLVVEDEPMILRHAQIALSKLGYRVLTANDGQEALELVKQTTERIDLLVTDVVMPRLGGRDLALRLRELSPTTKVLYTSGYAENALAVQGALPQGVNLMQKPYSLAALAKRVRETLDASSE